MCFALDFEPSCDVCRQVLDGFYRFADLIRGSMRKML